jgi:periplasmic divalent cation tolerance protein
MNYCLVQVTLPASIPSVELVQHLLEKRLIAGVNIVPDLLTYYLAHGEIQETRETLYLGRTTSDCINTLRVEIEEKTGEHDFEISVILVRSGNPVYEHWIQQALAHHSA